MPSALPPQPASSPRETVAAHLPRHAPIPVTQLATTTRLPLSTVLWALRELIKTGQARTQPPGLFVTAETRVVGVQASGKG